MKQLFTSARTRAAERSTTLGERVRLVDPDRDLEEQTAWILSRETTDGENWTITVIGMW